MSRKNRNGKRRNYTPKTYSRDFLTPTPIERAIQEVNKPASPQAVAVSDRIACDDKCSYEYKRMPAAWLETDFSYQRKIDAARVERIVNSFDPRLANEVKVSFRDGKFYVFDGAHTLSALKRIHGEGALKRRIMDMGITKGVQIYVRKVAPLGDPIEVTVRDYELSLRKADAEMIETV